MCPAVDTETTSSIQWFKVYLAKICLPQPFQPQSKSLQILHVHSEHWFAVSTVGCTAYTEENIVIYASKYSSLSVDTKVLLSQLVHSDKPIFTVKIASVTKQSGSAHCRLFSVAYITSIAFDLEPCTVISHATIPTEMFKEKNHTFPNFERKTLISYCMHNVH